MKKKHHEEEHENAERWLLTYADLITLLLAFFIVMYSMSKVDAKKFGAMSTALNRILSGGGLLLKGDQGTTIAPKQSYVPVESGETKLVMADLITELRDHNLISKVKIRHDPRGVVLSLSEKVLFPSGSAELSDSARILLDTLSVFMSRLPNEVRVEGHTDNVPIRGRYSSNWELSTSRATSVVRYMVEQHLLPPYQLSAAGYSEFRPVAPNDSPENRTQNRRVDLVILSVAPPVQVEAPIEGDKHGR